MLIFKNVIDYKNDVNTNYRTKMLCFTFDFQR